MKTIVAGGRDITDYEFVAGVLDKHPEITEVVCGMALSWLWKDHPTTGGVDRLGHRWATANKIPIKPYPADWSRYGSAAGHIRNGDMAEYGDQLIAVWDGKSKGTGNMIATMRKLGKPVFVIRQGA